MTPREEFNEDLKLLVNRVRIATRYENVDSSCFTEFYQTANTTIDSFFTKWAPKQETKFDYSWRKGVPKDDE